MKIRKKIKGIEFKTLLIILLFNVGIILSLWFSERIIFDALFKNYQLNKINEVVESLKTSTKDTYVMAEKLAYENEVCISLIDENNYTYNYNTMQEGCILNKKDKTINRIIADFNKGNSKSNYYRFKNHYNNIDGILYAYKVNHKNIFIYSDLEDSSNFMKLFRGQKVYYLILMIVCSFIISVFLANKITKPIKEITTKAKRLGEGKYNTEFPKNGVLEIEELSKTLDDVQKQLSKNEETQRNLLANVSHDLKTPLTMIKAYAEMIRDISYKDNKKMNEHLHVIMDESDRLTLLVNDILELSKIQNDAFLYNYETYDLVKEIKKIIQRYSDFSDLKDYEFVLDIPKKAIVRADRNKINQVIYNLLNNAINYTGKDKKVIVNITKEDNSYLVKIIDTGKGIKKEEIPYIWDKYYKNEKNHQRNVVGTGLGLAIVKEILVRHNFEYGVETKNNKGSIFYFKISSS